ncbi:hypothetical protein LT330_000818 [Penicillium expansum]|uniref:Protein-lysine N-methyltransferase EFM6 n=1 Tax=Penicillium expansum TaxID=27334 RepID=A0A0A2JGC8_PENEN|nr:hypothetical protein PEX2_059500 [Penicillium expansum]KAK4867308.1 hypothetical protein LT330_000818 [Penicillium expansum]KGO39930.1 hypothetical protein PEXP_033130 [Penicillium expansum]KGO53306.1 hypothetical protein PEX2_059500 [Penicillium expansum]KGO53713.1 hypothetical protein PEX1_082890 [Penicillium expansum]
MIEIPMPTLPGPDLSPPSSPDGLRVSESLAPPRELKAAVTTDISFDGLLKEPLLLKEDLKDGCGGQLWPAGMALAKYLLSRHTTDLSDKTIVELGAGGGLVGLAVARGCHLEQPIYITDQEPMFSLMKSNIQLNNLGANATAAILNWGEPIPSQIPSKPDVILAADCVYFEPAFPLLITTLQDLLGPDTVCYFCYKRRRRADMRFMKMAKKAFEMEQVRDDPGAEAYNRENIFLYTIRAKRLDQKRDTK